MKIKKMLTLTRNEENNNQVAREEKTAENRL